MLYFPGKSSRYPFVGGWVYHRADLGAVEKIRISWSFRESNSSSLVIHPLG
jgi:hypothetical protein